MHWDDLGMRRGYFGLAAYDQSKLAVVLFTREMARRLGPGSRVSTYAVDPGLVRTDIGAKGTGLLVRLVWRLRTRNGISARDSARWIAFLASDPGVAGMSGLYWKERKVVEPSEAARSAEDAERLWNTSETLARPGATAPDYEPNLLPSSSMAR
jgi:NAD(P)-dependent dehydrogenase (short-subunit alcohol dehydrogenase family)